MFREHTDSKPSTRNMELRLAELRRLVVSHQILERTGGGGDAVSSSVERIRALRDDILTSAGVSDLRSEWQPNMQLMVGVRQAVEAAARSAAVPHPPSSMQLSPLEAEASAVATRAARRGSTSLAVESAQVTPVQQEVHSPDATANASAFDRVARVQLTFVKSPRSSTRASASHQLPTVATHAEASSMAATASRDGSPRTLSSESRAHLRGLRKLVDFASPTGALLPHSSFGSDIVGDQVTPCEVQLPTRASAVDHDRVSGADDIEALDAVQSNPNRNYVGTAQSLPASAIASCRSSVAGCAPDDYHRPANCDGRAAGAPDASPQSTSSLSDPTPHLRQQMALDAISQHHAAAVALPNNTLQALMDHNTSASSDSSTGSSMGSTMSREERDGIVAQLLAERRARDEAEVAAAAATASSNAQPPYSGAASGLNWQYAHEFDLEARHLHDGRKQQGLAWSASCLTADEHIPRYQSHEGDHALHALPRQPICAYYEDTDSAGAAPAAGLNESARSADSHTNDDVSDDDDDSHDLELDRIIYGEEYGTLNSGSSTNGKIDGDALLDARIIGGSERVDSDEILRHRPGARAERWLLDPRPDSPQDANQPETEQHRPHDELLRSAVRAAGMVAHLPDYHSFEQDQEIDSSASRDDDDDSDSDGFARRLREAGYGHRRRELQSDPHYDAAAAQRHDNKDASGAARGRAEYISAPVSQLLHQSASAVSRAWDPDSGAQLRYEEQRRLRTAQPADAIESPPGNSLPWKGVVPLQHLPGAPSPPSNAATDEHQRRPSVSRAARPAKSPRMTVAAGGAAVAPTPVPLHSKSAARAQEAQRAAAERAAQHTAALKAKQLAQQQAEKQRAERLRQIRGQERLAAHVRRQQHPQSWSSSSSIATQGIAASRSASVESDVYGRSVSLARDSGRQRYQDGEDDAQYYEVDGGNEGAAYYLGGCGAALNASPRDGRSVASSSVASSSSAAWLHWLDVDGNEGNCAAAAQHQQPLAQHTVASRTHDHDPSSGTAAAAADSRHRQRLSGHGRPTTAAATAAAGTSDANSLAGSLRSIRDGAGVLPGSASSVASSVRSAKIRSQGSALASNLPNADATNTRSVDSASGNASKLRQGQSTATEMEARQRAAQRVREAKAKIATKAAAEAAERARADAMRFADRDKRIARFLTRQHLSSALQQTMTATSSLNWESGHEHDSDVAAAEAREQLRDEDVGAEATNFEPYQRLHDSLDVPTGERVSSVQHGRQAASLAADGEYVSAIAASSSVTSRPGVALRLKPPTPPARLAPGSGSAPAARAAVATPTEAPVEAGPTNASHAPRGVAAPTSAPTSSTSQSAPAGRNANNTSLVDPDAFLDQLGRMAGIDVTKLIGSSSASGASSSSGRLAAGSSSAVSSRAPSRRPSSASAAASADFSAARSTQPAVASAAAMHVPTALATIVAHTARRLSTSTSISTSVAQATTLASQPTAPMTEHTRVSTGEAYAKTAAGVQSGVSNAYGALGRGTGIAIAAAGHRHSPTIEQQRPARDRSKSADQSATRSGIRTIQAQNHQHRPSSQRNDGSSAVSASQILADITAMNETLAVAVQAAQSVAGMPMPLASPPPKSLLVQPLLEDDSMLSTTPRSYPASGQPQARQQQHEQPRGGRSSPEPSPAALQTGAGTGSGTLRGIDRLVSPEKRKRMQQQQTLFDQQQSGAIKLSGEAGSPFDIDNRSELAVSNDVSSHSSTSPNGESTSAAPQHQRQTANSPRGIDRLRSLGSRAADGLPQPLPQREAMDFDSLVSGGLGLQYSGNASMASASAAAWRYSDRFDADVSAASSTLTTRSGPLEQHRQHHSGNSLASASSCAPSISFHMDQHTRDIMNRYLNTSSGSAGSSTRSDVSRDAMHSAGYNSGTVRQASNENSVPSHRELPRRLSTESLAMRAIDDALAQLPRRQQIVQPPVAQEIPKPQIEAASQAEAQQQPISAPAGPPAAAPASEQPLQVSPRTALASNFLRRLEVNRMRPQSTTAGGLPSLPSSSSSHASQDRHQVVQSHGDLLTNAIVSKVNVPHRSSLIVQRFAAPAAAPAGGSAVGSAASSGAAVVGPNDVSATNKLLDISLAMFLPPDVSSTNVSSIAGL